MLIFRAIWLLFFILGTASIAGVLSAFNEWAMATALPGTESYCRGALLDAVPLFRVPLCFAHLVIEVKTWLAYARGVLLQIPHGPSANELLRTVDVGLFALGGLAVAVALNWLWASAMTRVVVAIVAGSYTLMHGVAQMLGRRAA